MSYKGFSRPYQIGQEILDRTRGKLGEAGSLVLGPLGTALGYIFDESLQYLLDTATETSRYVQGVWYIWDNELGRYRQATEKEMAEGGKRRPGAKVVADPRWKDKPANPFIPLKPSMSPTIDIKNNIPLLPLTKSQSMGFNRQNFDENVPTVVIYNDGINHKKQVHPSSRRMSNAALPYNTQGFTSKRDR